MGVVGGHFPSACPIATTSEAPFAAILLVVNPRHRSSCGERSFSGMSTPTAIIQRVRHPQGARPAAGPEGSDKPSTAEFQPSG